MTADDRAASDAIDMRSLAYGDALVRLHDSFRGQLHQIVEGLDEGTSSAQSHSPGGSIDLPGYCLTFCRQLHEHHTEEDTTVFPWLAESEAGLSEVLDLLGTQHVAIAAGLVELQEAVEQHVAGPSEVRAHARLRIAEVVERITRHLDEEEEALVPVLNSLGRMGHDFDPG